MSASSETKITFEIKGTGASPSSMESTTSTTVPGSSDTGLFTSSDSLSAGSIIAGLSICFLVTAGIIALKSVKQPKMRTSGVSKNFNLKKGLFKKLGIFAFFILASGIALPNFLPESESASAIDGAEDTTGSLTFTAEGAGKGLSGSTTITGKTGALAFVKQKLTCSLACDIYLSTAAQNTDMYYGGDTTKPWIKASGSAVKSTLSLNTWGYALNAPTTPSATSSIWSVVPANDGKGKNIGSLDANGTLTVTFGAYVNNEIPAGSYSNTVVYTAITSN